MNTFFTYESNNIEIIEKENWKKANGIKHYRGETKSALAERNYNITCNLKLVCIIKGYHIWWCSTHHQPYSQCELDLDRVIYGNKRVIQDAIREVIKEK